MERDKVYRTLKCNVCLQKWKTEAFKGDPVGECPHCRGAEVKNIREGFTPKEYSPINGRGLASKAADITYSMMERDYGVTDLKDNLRAGDIAMKMPASDSANLMQQRGGFYGGGAPTQAAAFHGSSIDMARAAKQKRLAERAPDPMSFAQAAMNKSPDTISYARANPIARAKLS